MKYRNEKNTILRILDLAQAPNIKVICNALQFTRIKDVEKKATQILEKLKKSKSNLLGDIGHPQNPSMAVYYSCQLLKVKVDERKLIALSRLQRKQWTKLKMLWRPTWVDCTDVPIGKAMKETSKSATLTRKTEGIIQSPISLNKIENIYYDVNYFSYRSPNTSTKSSLYH